MYVRTYYSLLECAFKKCSNYRQRLNKQYIPTVPNYVWIHISSLFSCKISQLVSDLNIIQLAGSVVFGVDVGLRFHAAFNARNQCMHTRWHQSGDTCLPTGD